MVPTNKQDSLTTCQEQINDTEGMEIKDESVVNNESSFDFESMECETQLSIDADCREGTKI